MFQRRFAQSDDVVLEADEAVARQQRRVGERDVEGPGGEDEDVDEARDKRRRQHQDRHPLAEPRAPARRVVVGSRDRAQSRSRRWTFGCTGERPGRGDSRRGQHRHRASHLRFDLVGHGVGGVLGRSCPACHELGDRSPSSRRGTFCGTVMLCAIERTSVPASIDACRSFCASCWQGLKPFARSTSSRAGIEPLVWLKIVWNSGDRIRCWRAASGPRRSPGRSAGRTRPSRSSG